MKDPAVIAWILVDLLLHTRSPHEMHSSPILVDNSLVPILLSLYVRYIPHVLQFWLHAKIHGYVYCSLSIAPPIQEIAATYWKKIYHIVNQGIADYYTSDCIDTKPCFTTITRILAFAQFSWYQLSLFPVDSYRFRYPQPTCFAQWFADLS